MSPHLFLLPVTCAVLLAQISTASYSNRSSAAAIISPYPLLPWSSEDRELFLLPNAVVNRIEKFSVKDQASNGNSDTNSLWILLLRTIIEFGPTHVDHTRYGSGRNSLPDSARFYAALGFSPEAADGRMVVCYMGPQMIDLSGAGGGEDKEGGLNSGSSTPTPRTTMVPLHEEVKCKIVLGRDFNVYEVEDPEQAKVEILYVKFLSSTTGLPTPNNTVSTRAEIQMLIPLENLDVPRPTATNTRLEQDDVLVGEGTLSHRIVVCRARWDQVNQVPMVHVSQRQYAIHHIEMPIIHQSFSTIGEGGSSPWSLRGEQKKGFEIKWVNNEFRYTTDAVLIGCVAFGLFLFVGVKMRFSLLKAHPLLRNAFGTGTIILFTVVWTIFIIASYKDAKKGDQRSPFARALGQSALLCFSILMFPVTRHIGLGPALNMCFEKLIKYHQALALIALISVLLHVVWMMKSYGISSSGWHFLFLDSAMATGWLALLVLLLITLPALKFRRSNWSVFRYTHMLYPLLLLLVLIHHPRFFFYILPAGLCYVADVFLRRMRIINSDPKLLSATYHKDARIVELKVEVDVTSGGEPQPGQYTFLGFQKLGFLFHPFTIAKWERITPTTAEGDDSAAPDIADDINDGAEANFVNVPSSSSAPTTTHGKAKEMVLNLGASMKRKTSSKVRGLKGKIHNREWRRGEKTGVATLLIKDMGRDGSWTTRLAQLFQETDGPAVLSPTMANTNKDSDDRTSQTHLSSKDLGKIQWQGCYGRLTVPIEDCHTITLLAGGIGVTPFLSILDEVGSKSWHKNQEIKRGGDGGSRLYRVIFVWAVRDSALRELLLPRIREQLERIHSNFPHIEVEGCIYDTSGKRANYNSSSTTGDALELGSTQETDSTDPPPTTVHQQLETQLGPVLTLYRGPNTARPSIATLLEGLSAEAHRIEDSDNFDDVLMSRRAMDLREVRMSIRNHTSNVKGKILGSAVTRRVVTALGGTAGPMIDFDKLDDETMGSPMSVMGGYQTLQRARVEEEEGEEELGSNEEAEQRGKEAKNYSSPDEEEKQQGSPLWNKRTDSLRFGNTIVSSRREEEITDEEEPGSQQENHHHQNSMNNSNKSSYSCTTTAAENSSSNSNPRKISHRGGRPITGVYCCGPQAMKLEATLIVERTDNLYLHTETFEL